MTGRDLFAAWAGSDEHWPRQSPANQRAWDRLAARVEAEKAAAVAAVVHRREAAHGK